MTKKLTVGNSPLSNTIYCGSLIEKGTVWGANRTDVTLEALGAVVEHAMIHQKRTKSNIQLTGGGKRWTIAVKEEEFKG